MSRSNPFANAAYDLSPADVRRRVAAGEADLIDVREMHEREAGHIPGARHLEIDRVAWNYDTIDRARPVIFHCRLGWRGGMVAHAFRAIGYEAYNLDGGIAAWADAGLPLEPADGVVAEH